MNEDSVMYQGKKQETKDTQAKTTAMGKAIKNSRKKKRRLKVRGTASGSGGGAGLGAEVKYGNVSGSTGGYATSDGDYYPGKSYVKVKVPTGKKK